MKKFLSHADHWNINNIFAKLKDFSQSLCSIYYCLPNDAILYLLCQGGDSKGRGKKPQKSQEQKPHKQQQKIQQEFKKPQQPPSHKSRKRPMNTQVFFEVTGCMYIPVNKSERH